MRKSSQSCKTMQDNNIQHKSGFVAIVGKPNTGKSTLMNALIGCKIASTSYKPQTTRHRISGILNTKNHQVVFLDTPGVIEPKYELQENLLKTTYKSLIGVDVFLYLLDIFEDKLDLKLIKAILKEKGHICFVINKIDLVDDTRLDDIKKKWDSILKDMDISGVESRVFSPNPLLDKEISTEIQEEIQCPTLSKKVDAQTKKEIWSPKIKICYISAKKNIGVDKLKDYIINIMPTHPPYYPKDYITDISKSFIASEIIREKIFLNYEKEIPYSTEVRIESFEENDRLLKIKAIIYTERNSQKGIIIGHKGSSLTVLGKKSRISLEKFFSNKVFLDLYVKVLPNWRKNNLILSKFGYT